MKVASVEQDSNLLKTKHIGDERHEMVYSCDARPLDVMFSHRWHSKLDTCLVLWYGVICIALDVDSRR